MLRSVIFVLAAALSAIAVSSSTLGSGTRVDVNDQTILMFRREAIVQVKSFRLLAIFFVLSASYCFFIMSAFLIFAIAFPS